MSRSSDIINMLPNLTKTKEEIISKFNLLVDAKDVADLLEIDYNTLIYYLYRRSEKFNYTKFYLNKRSGGKREILKPITPILLLQRKLNNILHFIYTPKHCVHGFVTQRNVLTNAQVHAKRNAILNIDIKDFFTSINFGRVRGMFMGPPYNLPHKPATVLAQMCCAEGALPQGAPTSPIISNMICAKLDSELLRLARKYNCFYTRYADDITFSTSKKNFPKSIGQLIHDEEDTYVQIGNTLQNIIDSNGFVLNFSKARIQKKGRRKEVTGLTVNESPNVKRYYVRELRAIFNAINKYGLENAEKYFHKKYYKKQSKSSHPSIRTFIHGKLNYLKEIKGELDPVYRNLYNQYLQSLGKAKFYLTNPQEDLKHALWILESESKCEQGTGFFLSNYGIITNAHVVHEDTYAFQAHDYKHAKKLRTVNISYDLDIAILSFDGLSEENYSALPMGDPEKINQGDKLTLAGFPNYWNGDTPYITSARVAAFRIITTFQRLILNTAIIQGNSGGPVLNADNEVIGIATTGASNREKANTTEHHSAIPIYAIRHI